MDNNTFKLNPTDANVVELMYNEPKTGTNNYGDWYLYGVRKDGVETSFFATDALHKKLSVYNQGAKLSIQKEEYAPGKSAWTVQPLEGTTTSAPTTTTRTIDDRTHDIHKQVCLKLAVELFGTKKGDILSGKDVSIIEANTLALLDILEYSQKVKDLTISNDPVINDDMPF
tara:strand:- start:10828 stop:11340 length:513 start_codon:yes stop_codon:yes gene_type:complete